MVRNLLLVDHLLALLLFDFVLLKLLLLLSGRQHSSWTFFKAMVLHYISISPFQ
jgi:hypothetical protein